MTPTEDNINELRQYAVTATHYKHFFEHLSSMDWLRALKKTEIIDPPKSPPEGPGEFWPVAFALKNLYYEFPTEIVDLLDTLLKKHDDDYEAVWHIAQCAYHIGEDALSIVLKAIATKAVSKFLTSRDVIQLGDSDVIQLGFLASEKADPASDLLTSLFAKLLSPSLLKLSEDSLLYDRPKLVETFAGGTTKSNYFKRTEIICCKLEDVSESNHTRQTLKQCPGGRINAYKGAESDFFAILLSGLLIILEQSQSWTSAEAFIASLRKLQPFLQFPPFLQQRLLAWLLATSNNAQNETRIGEIAGAIRFNKVTGDYVHLLERIEDDCESAEFIAVWNEALGDAPDLKEIEKALSENSIPDEWRRKLNWVSILTDDSNQDWESSDNLKGWKLATQKLVELHLPSNRESLGLPYKTAFLGSRRSTAQELQMPIPEKATSLIANWEPNDPANLTLQETVQTPYELFSRISSEIRARNIQPSAQQIAELIDFIERIFEEPQFEYNINWSETRRSCIEFIHVLAELKIGYGSCRDRAWKILKAQIEDRSEPPGVSPNPNSDMFMIAFNRTCTYAMHTLIVFSDYECKELKIRRSETLQILEECLKLAGQDGIEFRAIIAPSLNFLEYLAPEWLENARDLLFGEHAPNGLAQKTVDQIFEWGQPSDWLFKNYKEMIEDSVKRHVPESLVHYLTGMLREHEGYSVKEVINLLKKVPSQATGIAVPGTPWQEETTAISYAGEQLARLLKATSDSQIHNILKIADCFWEKVLALKNPKHLGGFGWYSKVISMDNTLWAKRTLETLKLTGGHIKYQDQVSERALKLDDKKSCLEILNFLIRGNSYLYGNFKTPNHASQALESAQELIETPEYERLETALLERGILPKQGTTDAS